MKKKLIIYTCLICPFFCKAQKNLDYFIKKIEVQSLSSFVYKTRLESARVAYSLYKINYRPSVSVNGLIPSYNKDNFAVTQPDGSVKFISRSQSNSYLNIGVNQAIPFSGGTLSLNTDLTRFQDFVRNAIRYNGTPFFIKLSQPIFSYNQFKWDKRIEPLKLIEANLNFKANLLSLEYNICKLFFDVAEAQVSLELAKTNLSNTISNLSIEKRRVQIGTSTEDKILQLEMQQITCEQREIAARLAIRTAFLSMNSMFKDADTAFSEIVVPESIPEFYLNKEEIISGVKESGLLNIYYTRKKMEAESNLAKVKAQGKQVDVAISYGLNNAEDKIPAIYKNPNNQQRYNISFSMPIIDWGRRRNSISIAKLQGKEIDLSMALDETKLIADITSIIEQIPIYRNNILSTHRLDTLSEKRYVIANRMYELGKISLLELQAAEVDKDNATRAYVYALRQFWESFYLLRVKTNRETF